MTIQLSKRYSVPNEIKAQANLLYQAFGEVYAKTKSCWFDVRHLHTFHQLDDAFKISADAFIKLLIGPPEHGALGQLLNNCGFANQILETECATAKDIIMIIREYETQLEHLMIYYKKINERMNRETSSCQLPPEFLHWLTPCLNEPFEVYKNLQTLIVEHLGAFEKGNISASLSQLVELCEQLKNSNTEVVKNLKGISGNLDTIGSATPLDPTGSGGYGSATPYNIESRISAGIASVVGVDLKPPHTTDAEVLAFAQKLKNTLHKSVIKTSRYGSTVYELQRGGAVPTGSVSSNQIRGTQATFYKQAVQIKELVSGLLDKLTCQLNVCDDQTIDYFKEDIRTNVDDIVSEVGREGGALPQRVNTLVATLVDDVRELRVALGFQAPRAQQRDMDIADREENERNFQLLEDSLINPPSSLTNLLARYFVEIGNATGTVLSNLLRAIEAIPPSIQEVYQLMDSVRLGEVDRRVTLVAGNTTIEQLLSWIEVSASSDWPSRLDIGGTREVEIRAVERTANEQLLLLDQLIVNLPNLIQTGVNRVGGGLRELRRELQSVRAFAHAI